MKVLSKIYLEEGVKMKLIKKIFPMIMVGITALVMSGCGGGGGSSTPPPTQAPVILEKIRISPENLPLPVGVEVQYEAKGMYSDGTTKDLTAEVSWSSSDNAIATIDATGKVTSVAVGTATISAVFGELSASTKVMVNKELVTDLASIQLTFANGGISATVPAETTGSLIATAIMTDGTTFKANRWVTFSSSNEDVAKVAKFQNYVAVKAIANGDSVITAAYESVTSNIVKISVIDTALESIIVSPQNSELLKGETERYSALGIYSNGDEVDISKDVDWISSKEEVAKIDPKEGLAKAVNTGETTITANKNGVSGSTNLTVLPTVVLESIQLTLERGATGATVPAGTSGQLVAYGNFSDGKQRDITLWDNVKYQVNSKENAVDVTKVGDEQVRVRALRKGKALITASLDGITSNTVNIQVTDAKLESIEVLLNPSSINEMEISLLSAKGKYSDGQEYWITYDVYWISKDTDIVTIKEGWLTGPRARGINAGTAIISATLDRKSGEATLTVQ